MFRGEWQLLLGSHMQVYSDVDLSASIRAIQGEVEIIFDIA